MTLSGRRNMNPLKLPLLQVSAMTSHKTKAFKSFYQVLVFQSVWYGWYPTAKFSDVFTATKHLGTYLWGDIFIYFSDKKCIFGNNALSYTRISKIAVARLYNTLMALMVTKYLFFARFKRRFYKNRLSEFFYFLTIMVCTVSGLKRNTICKHILIKNR